MPEWMQILAAVGGLGGLAAALMSGATALKYRAESHRADRTSYREETEDLRSERRKLEDLLKGCKGRLERRDRETEVLRERLSQLEEALPLALVAPRLLQPLSEGLAKVLDHIGDLVAITSASEGGKFLWVNHAWEVALGVPRDELLGRRWTELIHPDDLRRTQQGESTAWVVGVDGLVNRYRTASGDWLVLRWVAAAYRCGISIGVARIETTMAGDGGTK